MCDDLHVDLGLGLLILLARLDCERFNSGSGLVGLLRAFGGILAAHQLFILLLGALEVLLELVGDF